MEAQMLAFVQEGLPIHWLIKAIILAVLCAIVFRKVGKGVDGARSKGFVAVFLASLVLHGAPGAIMGLGWCLTRSQPFKDDAATPTKLKHFLAALIRMIWPMIASAVCFFAFDERWAPVGALVGVAGYLAWAAWYGDKNDDSEDAGVPINPKWNVLVERGQGAIAAAAYSLSLSL